MTHDAWRPDVHCRHCARFGAVAEQRSRKEGGRGVGARRRRREPLGCPLGLCPSAELERRVRDAGPSASERSLRGRIGAYTRWANTEDRYMATRPAREGFYAKFEREVDPEGKLTPQERAKRAEWAMKAHMQRMALKSAKARKRNQ